jgi:hypothetical protein
LTKDITLHGSTKISLIGEVYNLLQPSQLRQLQREPQLDGAATTALFGQPLQNYRQRVYSRQAQFAFRSELLSGRVAFGSEIRTEAPLIPKGNVRIEPRPARWNPGGEAAISVKQHAMARSGRIGRVTPTTSSP